MRLTDSQRLRIIMLMCNGDKRDAEIMLNRMRCAAWARSSLRSLHRSK